jgi:hypothetical protein
VALEFGIEDRVKSGTLVARNGFVAPNSFALRRWDTHYDLLRTHCSACTGRQIGIVAIPKETLGKPRVQCYAGYRGEEEPLAMALGGHRPKAGRR